ncbi:MAG: hypothetical protein WC852_00320 [Candidatus Nanoarchaeia archaeon]|jgi:hypothetical protein
MTEYVKLSNDEKVIGNSQVGWNLELEGVCRGVIYVPPTSMQYGGWYNGILQRTNGEMVPFNGESSFEAMIAKASSETGQAVKMWCKYSSMEVKKGVFKKDVVKGLWLIVDGLMLGDLKSW